MFSGGDKQLSQFSSRLAKSLLKKSSSLGFCSFGAFFACLKLPSEAAL